MSEELKPTPYEGIDGRNYVVIPVSDYDQLRAELAALKAGQAEAAEYQQLSRYGHWERVDKSLFGLGLIGACPERFRALYTSPPSDPGTVAVLKEAIRLLDMYAPGGGSAEDFCLDDLRALLAQHEGVKP